MFGFGKKKPLTNDPASSKNSIEQNKENVTPKVKEEEDIFALAAMQEEANIGYNNDSKASQVNINQASKQEETISKAETNSNSSTLQTKLVNSDDSLKQDASSNQKGLSEIDSILFDENKSDKESVELKEQDVSSTIKQDINKASHETSNQDEVKAKEDDSSANLSPKTQDNNSNIEPKSNNVSNSIVPEELSIPEANLEIPSTSSSDELKPNFVPSNNYDPQVWIPQLIEVLQEINKENSFKE